MPTTYASAKQFLGLAKETTHGTAVTPITSTVLVEEFGLGAQFEQLKDTAWRGHMGAMSGVTQGVGKVEFDGSGPVFADTLGDFLLNILGDLTTTSGTPNSHAFSLLNSGTAQPASHTLAHFQGPVATSGTRVIPGACLSEVTFKFDAESELFTWDFKGTGWPTSIYPTAAPTSAPTAILPIASWRAQVGIGGPASSGTLVTTVNTFEVTIKRTLKPYYTLANTKNPYIIQRGSVEVSGKLNFVAADEAPHLAFLNHTQPQIQVVITNGGSGASLLSWQFDTQKANYNSAKFSGGNEAAEYEAEFESISTPTNAGSSGGMSPCKITLQNAVESY